MRLAICSLASRGPGGGGGGGGNEIPGFAAAGFGGNGGGGGRGKDSGRTEPSPGPLLPEMGRVSAKVPSSEDDAAPLDEAADKGILGPAIHIPEEHMIHIPR